MFIRSWKKELLTIPNMLSMFRLLLIPVYMRMYLQASTKLDFYLAGTVLGISCLTDLADGKIAREFNMISNVGKLLDPLADKLTQFALILSLSFKYRILYPILFLFLLKETFQFVCLLFFAQKGKFLPGALAAGKICTTVLFSSLFLLVLIPELNQKAVFILVIADALFLLYAFAEYANAYFGKDSKLSDLQNE